VPIDRFSVDRALTCPFIGQHSINGHCRRNYVAHPSGVHQRRFVPIDRFSVDRALTCPFIGQHSINGHCRRNYVAHPSGVHQRIKLDERYTIRLLFVEWFVPIHRPTVDKWALFETCLCPSIDFLSIGRQPRSDKSKTNQ